MKKQLFLALLVLCSGLSLNAMGNDSEIKTDSEVKKVEEPKAETKAPVAPIKEEKDAVATEEKDVDFGDIEIDLPEENQAQ